MQAFAGSAAFKDAVLVAMADDIPDTTDLITAARAYGLPSWWAHLATTLQAGLPPDRAAIFPGAAIKTVAPGAELERVRDDFMVLALTAVLGLDPTIKQAKALRNLWGIGDIGTPAWRKDAAKLGVSLKARVKAKEVEVRRAQHSADIASSLAMRASCEKILAAKVIACEAARAASYADDTLSNGPAKMVAPLAVAVAARVWLEVIGTLDLPKSRFQARVAGSTRARIAAADAAWAAIMDQSVARAGYADAHAFLATAFLEMTWVAK